MNYKARIGSGLFFILFTVGLFGQQEEVRVVKPYSPTLSGAEKMQLLPSLNEEIDYEMPEFSYDLFQKRYDTEFKITPIVAARMMQMPLKKLYKSYLKAGMGNYLTPYAELNVNQLRSRKGTMGVTLRHHSMNGKVKLDNGEKVPGGFSDNYGAFYGSRFFKNSVVQYQAGASYNTAVHYGIDPALDTSFARKDLVHPYFTGFASLGMQSTHADTFHLDYNGTLQYHYFTHDFNETEHGIRFNMDMNKSLRVLDLAGELGFSYFGHVPEWDTVLAKHMVFKINPWIAKSAKDWKFVAGFNSYFEVQNGTMTPHFYPKARFEFNIVEEVIVPYFGVDGYLESNNYRTVAEDNPYINPGLSVKPTSHKLIAFAGLKGRFSDAVSWNIAGQYAIIDNQYFYVNDTSSILKNQFSVIYDDLTLLNLKGEFTVRPSDSWKIFLKGNYYSYSMVREDYAWHKPDFDANLQVRYNMSEKFIIDGGIFFIGPRYFKNIDIGGAIPVITSDKLPATFDLNLGVEYRYSTLLSFWVKLNNAAAQKYYHYSQYPSFRFRFMAGFSYAL